MDALLSLPFVSYLLMPSITSYSTSLNLLFFYMTWSTLILSQPPLRVEVIGTLAIRGLFWLLPSLLFLAIDSIIPSLAVSFKLQGSEGLPARGARKSRNRPEWYRVLGLSLFNLFLQVGLQVAVELLFTDVFGIRSAMKITTTLPMPWSIFKDVGKILIAREVLTYYIHRYILHSTSRSQILRSLTNLHKSYYHSVTAPYSLSAYNDHPLPSLLHRFVPFYLPALLVRPHLLTYLLCLSLITLEETLCSSGYNAIPGIMLGGMCRRCDLHSESRGRGNYGSWGILDWYHGTSVGGDVMEDVKDEAEKHDVKGRGGRALSDAVEGGKEGLKALRNGNGRARRKSTRRA